MDKESVKEKTRKAYDKIGPDYDKWYWMKKSRELRSDLTKEVIERLETGLKTVDSRQPKILDLCCGTGHLVDEINKIGEYTGLDFAPAMIEYCSVKYPKDKFVLGDAEKLPFKENSFDAVVCFWSFHHILYPENVLDEIKRLLKPGGLIIISTFKDAKLNIVAKVADWTSDRFWGYTTKRYSESEMGGLMKGFKNIKIEIFPKGFSFLNSMGIRFLIVSGRKWEFDV